MGGAEKDSNIERLRSDGLILESGQVGLVCAKGERYNDGWKEEEATKGRG